VSALEKEKEKEKRAVHLGFVHSWAGSVAHLARLSFLLCLAGWLGSGLSSPLRAAWPGLVAAFGPRPIFSFCLFFFFSSFSR